MDTVNILGAKISMMGIDESVDYIMDMMEQDIWKLVWIQKNYLLI